MTHPSRPPDGRAGGFRWRRGRLAALAACVVTVLAVFVALHAQAPGSAPAPGPEPRPGAATSAVTAPVPMSGSAGSPGGSSAQAALTLGPSGVQSSLVVTENARPGSPDWQISSTPATGTIEGWADHVAAQVGDTVRVYVSTTAATFHVTAYRMGYYGGAGARAVWTSDGGHRSKAAALPGDPGGEHGQL